MHASMAMHIRLIVCTFLIQVPSVTPLTPDKTDQIDCQSENELELATCQGKRVLLQASQSSIKTEEKKQQANLLSIKEDMKKQRLQASSEMKDAQPAGGASTTTYKSWFQRMKESMGDFAASPFMMCFAVAVMWLNERRNARMETLITKGNQDVLANVKSNAANPENRGCLVHIKDGQIHGVGTLIADKFTKPDLTKVELSNVIKLETEVQVYQWREDRQEEKKKDTVGGGEMTKVTYSYHMEWSSDRHDSTSFQEQRGHVNRFAIGPPHSSTKSVDRVEYGDGFLLPNDLVKGLNDFVDASDPSGKAGDKMACDLVMWGEHHFCKADKQERMLGILGPAYHYYWREDAQTYRGGDEPRIGDYRVAFRCVPDGLGTVLALQAESDDGDTSNRDTFLPYRVIERRCCGWTKKMEKAALLKEGQKSEDELEEQDRCCGGGCICCCCCCHLVNFICSYVARPQIFMACHGERTVSKCFADLKQGNTIFTWLIRVFGWILMSVALDMFLSPFTTFLDVIPIIGWLGNKAIAFVSGFVSFVITVVIISMAYLVYHPSIGIPMLAGALALIATPIIIQAQLYKK